MRGDLLCATCLLSAWCPWSDLLNLTSTTPFVCPHMHCFQNNPPSNPGWFYPSRKTLIPPLSASFTFNKRVFSITAFIRGHKRDTNPTPCLRLSLSLFPLLHWCCYLPRWWCHWLSGARASLPKTGRQQSRFDRFGRTSQAAFPFSLSPHWQSRVEEEEVQVQGTSRRWPPQPFMEKGSC